MRKSLRILCLQHDVATGIPSDYRPRFRPRRLVMPVDPERLAHAKMNKNPGLAAHRHQRSLMASLLAHGSTQLGTVPVERTQGDAFRMMLEHALKTIGVARDDCLIPSDVAAAAAALRALDEAEGGSSSDHQRPNAHSAQGQEEGALAGDGSGSLHEMALSSDRGAELTSLAVRGLHAWELLDRTWLGHPAHGGLALQGKSLVELAVAELAATLFPRLRSRHLQFILQQTCGLLPCCKVASQLGLVDIAKVETDVGLWSELNKLMTSYQTARKMSTLHKERAANSMALNRRWYWRRQLRSVANTIALFPATEDDLRPRVEWLRSLLFSFVAFVKLTEGDHRCRVLIHRLFCRSLAEHQQRLRILTELQARAQQYHTADEKNMCDPGETASPKQGKGIVESPEESAAQRTSSNNMREAVEKVLEEYERLIGSRRRWGDDPDARALREEAVHPMNAAADGKRLMRSSTAAGTHYNLEETGNFETFVRPRHAQRAPEIILRAVEAVTGNSYKEVQLVLQHDPSVAPVLREAKLDVEQTIEREVKVEETHKLRMLQQRQQFRQSETMKVRLMAGPLHAVGEGRGDHLHEAIHNAGLDMLHFYYSRKQPAGPAAPASTAASGPASGVQDSAPTTANAQHGSSVGLDSDGSTKDTQPSDSSDYFF